MYPTRQISSLLRAISQPIRIKILLAIGTGEACVCHLEAAIGQRQAYISQQLMALREAGIVASWREGRNIYYRLKDPNVLELIQHAGRISGLGNKDLPIAEPMNILEECPCPHCMGEGIGSSPEKSIPALYPSDDVIRSEKRS